MPQSIFRWLPTSLILEWSYFFALALISTATGLVDRFVAPLEENDMKPRTLFDPLLDDNSPSVDL